MIRRREPEDAALCGGEGGDEGAEMGGVALVRVLFDPFPVVVGAAEPETPGIALAVEALKIFQARKIDDLIVINNKREPVGLIDSQDLPKLKLA